MSEKNEKIDWSQLTPEAAYKRITEFANKLALNYPKPNYSQGVSFKFLWDNSVSYTYEGVDTLRQHVFSRDSDGQIIHLSKYAFLPYDQPTLLT